MLEDVDGRSVRIRAYDMEAATEGLPFDDRAGDSGKVLQGKTSYSRQLTSAIGFRLCLAGCDRF
jgi:hypothetical protein